MFFSSSAKVNGGPLDGLLANSVKSLDTQLRTGF